MKQAETAREKLVGDVVRENKRLAEPLSQVRGCEQGKMWNTCNRTGHMCCWPADTATVNSRQSSVLAPQAVAEAEALRTAAASAERDRATLASAKARLAAAERAQRAVEWELEVTQQRLERVRRGAGV